MKTRAFKYALKKGYDREDAEDFSQDLEVKKLEGKNHEFVHCRLIDWLRVKRGRCIDRQRLHMAYEFRNEPYIEAFKIDEFHKYISDLPEETQLALELRFRSDWTLKEIGEHFKITEQAMYARINKALENIKWNFFSNMDHRLAS